MDAWIQPHFESKAAFFFFFFRLHFPFLLFPRAPLTVWWNWSGGPFPLLLLQLWAHVSAQSHRGGRRYSAFRSAHKARPNKRSRAEKSGCGGASADLWVTRHKQTGLLLTSTILPSRNKSSRYFYQQKMSRSWGQNKDGSVQAPDLGINNSGSLECCTCALFGEYLLCLTHSLPFASTSMHFAGKCRRTSITFALQCKKKRWNVGRVTSDTTWCSTGYNVAIRLCVIVMHLNLSGSKTAEISRWKVGGYYRSSDKLPTLLWDPS